MHSIKKDLGGVSAAASTVYLVYDVISDGAVSRFVKDNTTVNSLYESVRSATGHIHPINEWDVPALFKLAEDTIVYDGGWIALTLLSAGVIAYAINRYTKKKSSG